MSLHLIPSSIIADTNHSAWYFRNEIRDFEYSK